MTLLKGLWRVTKRISECGITIHMVSKKFRMTSNNQQKKKGFQLYRKALETKLKTHETKKNGLLFDLPEAGE